MAREDERRPASGAGKGAIDLGLERMHRLMGELPPLTIPAIHLAGTNGKGSVSALLDSVLLASGLSTGRYNSPHLVEPRDAIRINGQPPPQEEYERCMREVMDINARLELGASTFEIATAAAFLIIQRAHVDVMIIECGMGGARDATNVLRPNHTLACGLTAVGLDHTGFLGSTVEAITEEKAKIVGQDGTLCIAAQPHPGVAEVARRTALGNGAANLIPASPVHQVASSARVALQLRPFVRPEAAVITASFQGSRISLKSGLPGAHQQDNLALAISILDHITTSVRALAIQPKLCNVKEDKLRAGVEHVQWEGRCSWLVYDNALPILVDGAHNADSAKTLRAYIDSLDVRAGASSESPISTPPIHWIMSLSFSSEKSIESVLSPLLRSGDTFACLPFGTPVEGMPWVKPVPPQEVAEVAMRLVSRAADPESQNTIAAIIEEAGVPGLKLALESIRREWETNEPRLTVVCGSLYLVADAYRLLSSSQ